MRTLSTDQGSGFTSDQSDVMNVLLAVLGVKVHTITTVANSEGLGVNESINNVNSGVVVEIDARLMQPARAGGVYHVGTDEVQHGDKEG